MQIIIYFSQKTKFIRSLHWSFIMEIEFLLGESQLIKQGDFKVYYLLEEEDDVLKYITNTEQKIVDELGENRANELFQERDAYIAKLKEAGRNIGPFPKPTLEDWKFENGVLYTDHAEMNYQTLVFAAENPLMKVKTLDGRIKELRDYQNSISVGTAIQSEDNQMIYFRRADWVGEKPNALHVTGTYTRLDSREGYVQPLHHIDALTGVKQLQHGSEFGITPEDIESIYTTNIARVVDSGRYEITNLTKVKRNSDELKEIFHQKRNELLEENGKPEHTEIFARSINDTLEHFREEYVKSPDNVVEVGYASILAAKPLIE